MCYLTKKLPPLSAPASQTTAQCALPCVCSARQGGDASGVPYHAGRQAAGARCAAAAHTCRSRDSRVLCAACNGGSQIVPRQSLCVAPLLAGVWVAVDPAPPRTPCSGGPIAFCRKPSRRQGWPTCTCCTTGCLVRTKRTRERQGANEVSGCFHAVACACLLAMALPLPACCAACLQGMLYG